MKRITWLVVAAALGAAACQPKAPSERAEQAPPDATNAFDEETIVGKGFFIAPVKTPLQRLFFPDVTAIAQFDMDAMLSTTDGSLDMEGIDLDGFAEAMKHTVAPERDYFLRIHAFVDYRDLSEEPRDLRDRIRASDREVDERLVALGNEAGFTNVGVYNGVYRYVSGGGYRYREGWIGPNLAPGESPERNLGNELIGVYIVETQLSRWLSGESDLCLWMTDAPLDERADGFAQIVRQGVRTLPAGRRDKAHVYFYPEYEYLETQRADEIEAQLIATLRREGFREITLFSRGTDYGIHRRYGPSGAGELIRP